MIIMKNNLEKLSKIGFFDIKPGLERISNVLNYLSNPQNKTKYVLIAGTNGKGSVTSILSSILFSNGYKTGQYTSPHLFSVTERIKIDNMNITEKNFNKVLGVVFDACEETGTTLSYFEIVTASAFVYFEKENIDLGILEVGMGGRWDATNVVKPLISVITNISLDHTEHLGNTTELIAAEKAEIIKENSIVVSGVSGKEKKILYEKAGEQKSKIYFLEEDFNFKYLGNAKFNYAGIENNLNSLSTNLAGIHQIVNSSLALAASELLKSGYDLNIDFKNINAPLNSVNHEGRFEIININPSVILDAAHNKASAEALVNTLDEFSENNKFIFLISMLKDKNQDEFISIISKKAEEIVVTMIPNERGTETKLLYKISKKYTDKVEIVEDYKEAYEYVKTLNKPVCITGSIYLIGLIKEYLISIDPEINSG